MKKENYSSKYNVKQHPVSFERNKTIGKIQNDKEVSPNYNR